MNKSREWLLMDSQVNNKFTQRKIWTKKKRKMKRRKMKNCK